MIIIKKSPTADSRCCDAKSVSKDTLLYSTRLHRRDISRAMRLLYEPLMMAAWRHDDHKLQTIDAFHAAFIGGFADETWWNEHKKERHHLPDDLDDVNLMDILEHIADCVTAGMARTGSVLPLTISNEMLQKAFQNTVDLLIKNIEVED